MDGEIIVTSNFVKEKEAASYSKAAATLMFVLSFILISVQFRTVQHLNLNATKILIILKKSKIVRNLGKLLIKKLVFTDALLFRLIICYDQSRGTRCLVRFVMNTKGNLCSWRGNSRYFSQQAFHFLRNRLFSRKSVFKPELWLQGI